MNTPALQSIIGKMEIAPHKYAARYLEIGIVAFVIGGKSLHFEFGAGEPNLRLPLPPHFPKLWLSPDTRLGDLWGALPIKTFDYAIPQSFFNEYMAQHGETPRGIWLYDFLPAWGEFYSLSDCLYCIAGAMVRAGAVALGIPTRDGSPLPTVAPIVAPSIVGEESTNV